MLVRFCDVRAYILDDFSYCHTVFVIDFCVTACSLVPTPSGRAFLVTFGIVTQGLLFCAKACSLAPAPSWAGDFGQFGKIPSTILDF